MREVDSFKGWDSHKIGSFLYHNFVPAKKQKSPLGKTRYWQIAPGDKARLWPQMSKGGYIAVGWGETSDLSNVNSKMELFSVLKDAGQGNTLQKTQTQKLWSFFKSVKVGDKIVANSGKSKIVGVGQIVGDYYFDVTKPEYRHCKKVDWQWIGVKDIATQNKFGTTIVELSEHEFEALTKDLQPSEPASYWLFQANPNYYDLTAALSELKEMTWEVNQYKKDIGKGGTVFLWESGQNAGIVAIATVQSEPAVLPLNASEEKFIKDKERFVGAKTRVLLSIDKVLDDRIRRKDLLDNPDLKDLEVIAFANATNFRVTPQKAELILKLIDGSSGTYSQEKLIEDTGLDKPTLEKWERAINRKGQAIFYGPPGTGKTYVAECLAKYLANGADGFYDIIQFHPAYAYEDFIEGIRPRTRKEGGGLEYPMVPGRFLEFCKKAQGRNGLCVLIIDEINRANLSRVLGELMYLLEYRERAMYLSGGTKFRIPKNVRVIGTMNTADRSIALVDFALRRRFAFLKLYPNYEILAQFHAKSGFPVEDLIDTLKWLNKQINNPNYEIGITFFLRSDLTEQIESIWSMEIEPYLEEYFFDQADKVNQLRWDKVKEKIFKNK